MMNIILKVKFSILLSLSLWLDRSYINETQIYKRKNEAFESFFLLNKHINITSFFILLLLLNYNSTQIFIKSESIKETTQLISLLLLLLLANTARSSILIQNIIYIFLRARNTKNNKKKANIWLITFVRPKEL